MKKFFVTSILSVTLMTASIFGTDVSGLGANNTTQVASASTFSNIQPKVSVKSRTATTVSLVINKVSSANGYRIYRASSSNNIFKYIGSTNSTTYTDKKVKSNSSYYYKIKAYKSSDSGKENSKLSKTVSVTPTLAKTSYISANGASKSVISIAWSKVSGASKYNVYRSTTKNGTYSYLGQTKTNSYKNTGLASGKTYYYRIRAIKSVGNTKYYGVYSEKVAGTTTKAKTTTTSTKTKTTSTGKTATKAPTNSTSNQNYDTSFASQVLKIVNQERAKVGLKALVMSDSLTAPANKRAQEIKQTFSHTRPNGTKWSTVLDEYKVKVQTAGENIAYGYNTPEKVMDAWMNSEGHRANILGANYGHIGIGVYEVNGTVYCTQLFSN